MSRVSSICAAVVLLFVVVVASSNDLEGPVENGFPKTWIANLFYQALANFTGPIDVGSTACRQQTQMYIRHLKNDSLWAVKSQYNIPINKIYRSFYRLFIGYRNI